MTARRVPIADLTSGERRIEGPTAHYLARVLRLRTGDHFIAFDTASGREADVVAIGVAPEAMTVSVGALREGSLRATRPIAWIQGLAKGDKCDAIVRDATELGATRILVAATHRSVVRLDATRVRAKVARWSKIAEQAARQSGRSDAPAVESPNSWSEAIAAAGNAQISFCLWEEATDPLGPCLLEALQSDASLAFACGPEGGLEVSEVALARDRGWRVVGLGRRMLRTETVAAAVLGCVQICSALV